MHRRKRGVAGPKFRAVGSLAGIIALLVIIGAVFAPTAPAQVKPCGSVVKKLYNSPRVEFYRAKVFVVRGQAPCGEARRVIWRALQPGGYWGAINGWQCVPKGQESHIEKCLRERDGTTVIKNGKPKYCRACRRNSKRAHRLPKFAGLASISKTSWRRCGRVHYWRGRLIRVDARGLRCGLARKVARGFIADVVQRKHPCPRGICTVQGFTCSIFGEGRPRVLTCRKGRQVVHLRRIKDRA